MNEEQQVDLLTKSTMALIIGDVRVMRCQLCKQRDEDTVYQFVVLVIEEM
jgi:hypothetical protein